MNSKLTLSIKNDVIEEAKKYAQEQGRSLSNIIEEYLKSLTTPSTKKRDKELNSIVEELRGSLKLPDNSKMYKDLLEDALVAKYLKS